MHSRPGIGSLNPMAIEIGCISGNEKHSFLGISLRTGERHHPLKGVSVMALDCSS